VNNKKTFKKNKAQIYKKLSFEDINLKAINQVLLSYKKLFAMLKIRLMLIEAEKLKKAPQTETATKELKLHMKVEWKFA